MKIIKDRTARCGIFGCHEEAVFNIMLDKMIKVGGLGYQTVSFPICKEHNNKAYSEEALMKLFNSL